MREAATYYCGLGSSVKLIARTSRRPIPDNIAFLKHFSSPAPHALLDDLFGPGARMIDELYEQLNNHHIFGSRIVITDIVTVEQRPWRRVRVGPERQATCTLQLTCCIIMNDATPAWTHAQAAVDACLGIFRTHNTLDMEVEMMTTSSVVVSTTR